MRREFLSSKGEDNEEIEDGSELKLGDALTAPPLNIKNHQASNGISSSSSTIIRSSSLNYVFITLHIMCYAWSVFLLSVLFCLFAGHMLVGSLLCLCGRERHAPLFRLNTLVLRLYLDEYSYVLFVC